MRHTTQKQQQQQAAYKNRSPCGSGSPGSGNRRAQGMGQSCQQASCAKWLSQDKASPKAGPWHVLNGELLGCLFRSGNSGGGSTIVGCSSSWLLAVLLLPAAEPASTTGCTLPLLARLLCPRTAAAPDRSRLSSSDARPLAPVAGLEKQELMSELTALGTAAAAANAPPDAPDAPDALGARSLLLLLLVLAPPALARALRSALDAAAAASMCAAHGGSGSSELPVAAVLNGLAAAAANGLDMPPLPQRVGAGFMLLCRLLLLLLRPDDGGRPGSAGVAAAAGVGCRGWPPACCGDAHGPAALLLLGAAATAAAFSGLSPPAGGGDRSMMTTVMLSRLPLSTAALVSTVAATRAAALREAPFSRARLMERSARSVASWLLSTSHSPSLASSNSSSRACRANTEICVRHNSSTGEHAS